MADAQVQSTTVASNDQQKAVKCTHCRQDVPVDEATFARSQKVQLVGARKEDIQCPHCQKFFYPVCVMSDNKFFVLDFLFMVLLLLIL